MFHEARARVIGSRNKDTAIAAYFEIRHDFIINSSIIQFISLKTYMKKELTIRPISNINLSCPNLSWI